MRRFAILAYLLALMLYALAGTPLAPFHGDESTLVYGSRDYFDQFIARDMERVMNLRDDDPMDHNLRLLDGRVQTYLGGFAYHLTGGTAEGLNQPWVWGAPAQFNIADGHVPGDALLMAQRWAMALLLALSVPAAYGVGAHAGGVWGGLLMATLIAVSPNTVLNGRRAMMEAPLLLFTLLTALAALRIARFTPHPPAPSPTEDEGRREKENLTTEHTESTEEHREVSPSTTSAPSSALGTWHAALLFLLLGLGGGMALASKHSAAFSLVSIFGALGLWMLWWRDWRGIGGLAAAGAVAFGVYMALSPAWWADPLGTAREALEVREELLAIQIDAFDEYENFGETVQGFVDYAILEQPQYFEVPYWEEVGTTIATYESSPWALSRLANGIRALLTMGFAVLGIGALVRRRDGVAWLVGVWAAGTVATALLLTPLPWARYYLTALPAIYALAAAGAGMLARRLKVQAD